MSLCSVIACRLLSVNGDILWTGGLRLFNGNARDSGSNPQIGLYHGFIIYFVTFRSCSFDIQVCATQGHLGIKPKPAYPIYLF